MEKNVKHGQINRIDFSYKTKSLDVILLDEIYEDKNTSCSLTRNFNRLGTSQFCQHYEVTCDIMGLGGGGTEGTNPTKQRCSMGCGFPYS